MKTGLNSLRHRQVDDCGETLVVRDFQGVRVLADLVEDVIVVVPIGRRADLVRFSFCGCAQLASRDALTLTAHRDGQFCFVAFGHPYVHVFLQDLSLGQLVDVHSYEVSPAAFAVTPRLMPVLSEAVAVPIYALAA